MVPILSLEIGGGPLRRDGNEMTDPATLLMDAHPAGAQRVPFVVRENEMERAPEIAGEFYPQNTNLLGENAAPILRSTGNAELCTRICELAGMLGYNPAKTKMLIGQWRLDLVGLERKLTNAIDECSQPPPEKR